MPANGAVWSIDGADNIGVGYNENQTINGIKTRNGDKNIKIRVGDLVTKGAEFDRSNSSYTVADRTDVANSDVYIKNRNKKNATIVVNKSIPDGSKFDIKISNLSTRNISVYNEVLSYKDIDIEYTIEQGYSKRYVQFSITSPAEVDFQNDTYNSKTEKVYLEKLELINDSNHVVIWERSKEGKLIRQIGSSQGSKKEINVTSENISGETELAGTIHPGETEPNTNIIYAADNRSVQFPVPIKAVKKPIHYFDNSLNQSNTTSVLSILFNTEISSRQGNISIEFFDQSRLTINISEDSEKYRIDGNRVDISLNGTDSDSSNQFPYIEEFSANNLESKNSESTYSKTKYSPRRIAHTIENKTNITATQGTYIGLNSSTSAAISLSSEGQDIQQNRSYKHGNISIINTSVLSEGEYVIQSETNINQTQITLVNTTFSPNVPTTSVEDGIVAEFESTQSTRYIAANIRGDSKVNGTTVIINRSRTDNKLINISENGNYNISFTNVNTGKTVNKSVTVLKKKDLVSNLPVSAESVPSGQILPIEISSTYNTSIIQINDTSDNTTVATINLETPEEGQTTLGFNTYAAANGSLNESVSVTGSGASIGSVTTPGANGTLPPGTYEIAVRSEHGIAETRDNATVTIAQRSTNRLTTHAGTGVARSDLGSAAAVRDAIEGDTLSQSKRVGTNDTVVYAVNASGLAGLPAARNVTLETGTDLDGLDGLEFGVRSAGGDDGLPASNAVGETPRDSTVHVDETGLYVIADGADALPTDGELEPGEEFIAEFRVIDDRLREAASDPPDGHRATSTVTFADTDRGSLPGGDRERIASGDPVAGGNNGNGGGTTGTGGTAGGTTPTDPSGGGPEGPNAGSAAGTAGNDDRIAPARGVGFGVRPNAERRTPLLDGPIAVSAPTKIGETGTTGEAETPGGGTLPTDDGTTDAGNSEGGGAETTGDETDGSESGAGEPDRATPTYENAPIRATAEDVPGFGPLQSLAALAVTSLVAIRRRRTR
jgi:hypothetical protein